MGRRSRFWPSHGRLFLVFALILSLGLSACGGDDDDDDGGSGDAGIPLIDGADELESADMSEAETDEIGFNGTDGRLAAYKSDKAFDEVTDFYSADLEDGWDIVVSLPATDGQFNTVLSKEKEIAIILVTTGATAKADPSIMDDGSVTLDADEFADDDTLILAAIVTCAEADVTTCLAVFQQ